MRIAQLASNIERVPPSGYGGTELIVSLLTEELVKRGHEVTLFAVGESETTARLVSVTDKPLRTDERHNSSHYPAYELQTLSALADMQSEFDIVHNHMSWTSLSVLDSLDCQSVTTMHNHVKPYNGPLYKRYAHLPYVAISESFKSLNWPDELNYVATIYNGIDTSAYKGDSTNRDYLLFIGRLCYDKGTAEAIDIAQKLDMPIKVAGKVDPNDQEYFDQEVKPRLNYRGAEYIGEVNFEQKTGLYENAKALVYPINFDEPFGLVMAEAMAAGTPVLAFDRGSVQEVLSPETAVIGKTVDELVARYPEVAKISPRACMKRVQDLFSVTAMVDAYEHLYEALLAGGKTVRIDSKSQDKMKGLDSLKLVL